MHLYWMHQCLAVLWILAAWCMPEEDLIMIALGAAVFHSCFAIIHINQWRKSRVDEMMRAHLKHKDGSWKVL